MDRLVFLSLHDVAQSWWCAMYAVRKARHMEPDLFHAYLSDRVMYAQLLGLVKTLPTKDSDLLAIGAEITLEQVERLIAKSDRQAAEPRKAPSTRISLKARSGLAARYEEGAKVETTFAENYPRVRWNFTWEHFVVVAVADGLAPNFVYEFKSAKNEYWASLTRPIAEAQADLYGMFFRRPAKRIQVRLKESGKILTSESEINLERAVLTLETFREVEGGLMPPPPQAFKCRSCEYADGCPLRQR